LVAQRVFPPAAAKKRAAGILPADRIARCDRTRPSSEAATAGKMPAAR